MLTNAERDRATMRLEEKIARLLIEFRNETGLTPTEIEVLVQDHHTVEGDRHRYLEGVRVRAEL